MNDIVKLIIDVMTVIVPALFVWVWALWVSHNRHKLHVAETYVRRPEVEEIEKKLDSMRLYMQQQFSELLRTVYELKGRNGHKHDGSDG